MAEQHLSENARRELEANREARAESYRQFAERTKGKPTPTQDENDRAMLGESFIGVEHEHDGSDPDPNEEQRRQFEAQRGGSYQTRQTQARPAHQPSKPASSS